jgi:multiple antibiotic resistance protein
MELLKYMVLSGASLFVIIDPIATVPAFLAMTPKDGPEARIRMARLACIIAAAILILFVISGQALFRFLGITLAAFKIAGSIVLLLVSLDMLRARRSAVKETMEETYAGAEKDDIAITPLAVPMLAGPGAISTTILLHTQSPDPAHTMALLACIVVVCAVSYFIFRVAAKGATRFISPIAMKIVERLMGLLLAAVAIQFAIDGLTELGLVHQVQLKVSSPSS